MTLGLNALLQQSILVKASACGHQTTLRDSQGRLKDPFEKPCSISYLLHANCAANKHTPVWHAFRLCTV